MTPLHHAAKNNRKKTCDLLIRSKATVNMPDAEGNTPLLTALIAGSADAVQSFIKADATDLTVQNKKQQTPAHFLAAMGNIALLKSLAKKGLNWNAQDDQGRTPVELCADSGNAQCFEFLLTKLGGDPSVTNAAGESLAHIISAKGHAPLLGILKASGGNVDSEDANGCHPIQQAAASNSVPVIEALIKLMAQVNCADGKGDTPIHYAAANGAVEAVECLVNSGADINAKNKAGETALHVAVTKGDCKMINALSDKNIDVSLRDNNGNTALHLAIPLHNTEVINTLIGISVPPNSQNNDNMTALRLSLVGSEMCIRDRTRNGPIA